MPAAEGCDSMRQQASFTSPEMRLTTLCKILPIVFSGSGSIPPTVFRD